MRPARAVEVGSCVAGVGVGDGPASVCETRAVGATVAIAVVAGAVAGALVLIAAVLQICSRR